MNLLNAEAFFEDGGFEYVRFEQSDLHGMSRSKTVPVRHFRRFAENGLNFFGGLLGLISTLLGKARASIASRSITTSAMSAGCSCHAFSSDAVSPPNAVFTLPGQM